MNTTESVVLRKSTGRSSSGSLFKENWFVLLTLIILGFITFIPVLMLLQLSFKDMQQMADSMWLPIFPLHLKNYEKSFYLMVPYMMNSVLFVLGSVTVSITFSTLTSYALARYDFPGKEFFYMAILALLMIPGILTLITSFVVVVSLGINNSLLGIWLPMAAGAQAFQIIVLRTFFASLPNELFEAARIDGAGELHMLVRIALPLSTPILLTLTVLQIMNVWNEFIWPIMVLSNPDRYPIILGVLRLSQLITQLDPGATYAGYVIAGIPILILFVFSSRSFIRGLTSGAIKM
jgi:multiple sugar transport system permease protein/raffinose/stachyose/melibiose transport system permease protein